MFKVQTQTHNNSFFIPFQKLSECGISNLWKYKKKKKQQLTFSKCLWKCCDVYVSENEQRKESFYGVSEIHYEYNGKDD